MGPQNVVAIGKWSFFGDTIFLQLNNTNDLPLWSFEWCYQTDLETFDLAIVGEIVLLAGENLWLIALSWKEDIQQLFPHPF